MSPTLAPTSSEPTTAASNVTVEATPIYANRDAEIADTTTPAATTPTTQKKKKFDEAILAQMVEEEKRQSSKLPSYAGITDRYRLIEKMGDGAFSIVYKAHDLVSNEYVAIKIVSKQQLDASEVSFFVFVFCFFSLHSWPLAVFCLLLSVGFFFFFFSASMLFV